MRAHPDEQKENNPREADTRADVREDKNQVDLHMIRNLLLEQQAQLIKLQQIQEQQTKSNLLSAIDDSSQTS